MKKKLLSWLVVVALVVTMVPGQALAAETNEPNGESKIEAPTNPTRTDKLDFSEMETTDKLADEGWKWEKDGNSYTLTLENFYMKTSEKQRFVTFPDKGTINIVSEGYNIIEQTNTVYGPMISASLNSQEPDIKIILSGSGILEFKQPNLTGAGDLPAYAIATNDLLIKSGTYKANTQLCFAKKLLVLKVEQLTLILHMLRHMV